MVPHPVCNHNESIIRIFIFSYIRQRNICVLIDNITQYLISVPLSGQCSQPPFHSEVLPKILPAGSSLIPTEAVKIPAQLVIIKLAEGRPNNTKGPGNFLPLLRPFSILPMLSKEKEKRRPQPPRFLLLNGFPNIMAHIFIVKIHPFCSLVGVFPGFL